MPAGRRWSSVGAQPFFWKSVMSTTSRRGSVGLGEHGCRHLQRRARSAWPRRPASRRPMAASSRARSSIDCSDHLGAGAEEHQAGPVGGAEAVDRLAGRRLRPRPAVAVAHAVGAVEQDHDTSRAPPAAAADDSRRARTAGERRDDQRQRRQPQRQQRPVADLAPAHRLVGHPAQEHQRRERRRLLLSRCIRWINTGTASARQAERGRAGSRKAIGQPTGSGSERSRGDR